MNQLLAGALGVMLFAAAPIHAQTPSSASAPSRDTSVITRASGTFEVKLNPLTTDAPGVARYALDKVFSGDLQATSKGEMLANGTAEGFGVYVAVEVVTGTLNGRSGSFALHHNGVMDGGAPTLNVRVVPGSGTGDLAGITGTFNIILDGGKHAYEFDYSLPAAR